MIRFAEPPEPENRHLEHRSPPIRVQQVYLVDDADVDVGDEVISSRIVFAGRRVEFLGVITRMSARRARRGSGRARR